MNDKVLVHYGIEGQKWGQRNGPPYPLSPQDMSTAERRADTGQVKRVERDAKGQIIKRDYSNMSDEELRKTVERAEMENRYIKAVQASQAKPFIQVASERLGNVSNILNSANNIMKATTGKGFVDLLSKKPAFPDLSGMSTDDLKEKVLRGELEKRYYKSLGLLGD